jgi:SAM-dependent methyltransferase
MIATRFRFGENWQSFISTVDPASIAEAKSGLCRLFPNDSLAGKSFLDIGCGSGLAMLAAAQLGARVAGVDLDPQSVEAARALLGKHLSNGSWSVEHKSVFDLDPASDGQFAVVHSWGVLHHTGALWRAAERAAAMVEPRGQLAIALYRRTPLCGFWRVEKRLYAAVPPLAQAALRGLYKTAYLAGLVVTGRNPARYIKEYKSARGMDWAHDVHDWLGGYPYESAAPEEVHCFFAAHGFAPEREFTHRAVLGGLLGSHCDEYVARRSA